MGEEVEKKGHEKYIYYVYIVKVGKKGPIGCWKRA